MSSDYTTIRYSIENKVATVTLDRPEVSNAFNHTSYTEIRDAFEKAGKDPEVGAVVLTGAGKNFSAGGDIQDMQKWIDEGDFIDKPTVTLAGEMAMAIRRCSKPTIAMVNGAAAGAGAGCALACDFRIFAKTAKLILAFINLGLPGDTCSMYSLARQVGTAKATELMLLGEPISAEACNRLGLAYQVTAPEVLNKVTDRFAKRMANGPTAAYAKQKSALNEVFFRDLEKWINLEAKSMSAASKSEDFKIAVAAFLNKEQPKFIGK